MLGKFRLIGLLGEGATGKVIRAEDTRLRRYVALKCLKPGAENKPRRREKLLQEARLAATLDHPGIVQVYEVGEADGHSFISMELIEGGTLSSLIKGCGALDLRRACQLGAEAAEALAFAAEHGVVHRDIKPQNLLLTRGGRCKITDFGLASFADGNASSGVGTPAYVAPEVIAGEPATAKSDVYSLCGVMFFLLTGAPPFVGPTREAVLRMHVDTQVPDVRTRRPDLPPGIARVIAAGLSKNPAERPAPAELAEQLRAHTVPLDDSQVLSVSSAYVPMRQESPAAPPSPWMLVGSLVIGTAMVLAVVLVTAALMHDSPQTAAPPALDTAPPAEVARTEQQNRPATPDRRAEPAAGIVRAGDFPALLAAARERKEIVVEGYVSTMYEDASGKCAVLRFSENPGFEVLYPESLSRAMATRFGGRNGSGIQHLRVRVRGIPSLSGGKAIIELRGADEISPAP